MAGIKDVAKKAGVGVGTVSRMINDSGYVAEKTKKKILEAMEELDYTPNELARNLYHKRSGIIALLIPEIANPFFSRFVSYVEQELYAFGYKIMLCSTANESNAERDYLNMLKRHIVDGVITGVHSLDIEEYKKMNKPIVALDRYLDENIPVVASNHKEGGRIAAEILVSNGCKKVLHFIGETSVSSPYHERHKAFNLVMKENHVDVISYTLKRNLMEAQYYKDAAKEAFEKNTDFDGIFATDLPAVECMKEAIRRNKRIPEDIKIVAYDGTPVTELMEPELTTIVQPIDKLAKSTVELLMDEINGNKYKGKKVFLDVQGKEGKTAKIVNSY
ncbi:MAG: LacI family DNA-binding transcriptional regulator [Lachnospiraceae bacterium]|nr:LacI family DNA-binding transcriptional regulator [Lachnospiraceae bacterium]